jgi:hypothetical protein
MALADKCHLRIPFKEWGKRNGVPGGEQDFENWKTLERWADRCVGAAGASEIRLNLRGQITSVETDRVYIPPPFSPLTLTGFYASLSAYTGGTVTVELRKNGVAVATLNPVLGLVYTDVNVTYTYEAGDYATLAVTSWAAGSRGMNAGVI